MQKGWGHSTYIRHGDKEMHAAEETIGAACGGTHAGVVGGSIRCLKRYIAREVYRVLISCDALSSPTDPIEETQIGTGNNAA